MLKSLVKKIRLSSAFSEYQKSVLFNRKFKISFEKFATDKIAGKFYEKVEVTQINNCKQSFINFTIQYDYKNIWLRLKLFDLSEKKNLSHKNICVTGIFHFIFNKDNTHLIYHILFVER